MSFVVFPAVDISDGKCVRVLQGHFGTATVHSDDPVEVALGFCRAGARWLHIVDLDGARTGRSVNREVLLEVVKRSSRPVQAGGGLRTIDDVEQVLAAGAQRAVLSTAVLEDRPAVARACERYGERIAVSLDARDGELNGSGWTVSSGHDVREVVQIFTDAGVAQFNYTDVAREGTLRGPNLESLLRLTQLTPVPVVAAGGVSSLADLEGVAQLRSEGVAGAIVGRALYEHKFSVAEAIRVADRAASHDYEEELQPET